MYRTDGKDKINGYGTSASNSAYGKYIKVYMSADTSAITQIEYSWSSTYSGTYQVRTIGLDNKAYMSVNTAMTLIAYCGDEEPLYW